MSVKQLENGRWDCRFPVGGGKYKHKVFDKKHQALTHEAKMRDLVRGGGSFDAKRAKQSVETFAWEWYELQPDTPNYRQNISSHIRNHLLPELGRRPIGTVTQADLQLLVKKLTERSMVATTVRTITTTICMIFRAAVKMKVILEDPTVDLKLPAIVQREIKPLDIEQVNLIADSIFPRYRALILFTAASGLRQGEAFGTMVNDIAWEKGNGSVTVYKQIQSYTGAPQTLTDSTKSRRDRTVPLGDEVLDLLRLHIDSYEPVDGFIFTNTLGKPLHRRVFDRAFDAARRRAAQAIRERAAETCAEDAVKMHGELGRARQLEEEAVFHSLRHFYASLLIRQGLNPRTVAARLGHANPSLTLSRYAHLWPDDEDRTRGATKTLFSS